MFIYHITEESTWQKALLSGFYLPTAYEVDGFIHCSRENQVIRVAGVYYQDAVDLVLLKINTRLLEAPLIYENLEKNEEQFPHIYGQLNINSVFEALPFIKNETGNYVFPQYS